MTEKRKMLLKQAQKCNVESFFLKFDCAVIEGKNCFNLILINYLSANFRHLTKKKDNSNLKKITDNKSRQIFGKF